MPTINRDHSTRTVIFTAVWLLCTGPALAQSTIARWNESALREIRLTKLGPPVVARALAVAHTCMYDAWAAFDSKAIGLETGSQLRMPVVERTLLNQTQAVDFAAYRCLVNLFPAGEQRLRSDMLARGLNPDFNSTGTATPAGVGNAVATTVIASRRYDGSNQYGDLAPGAYADYTGYQARNAPMPYCLPQLVCAPLVVADPYHWQPLINDKGVLQKFIAPHWERVRPFALTSASELDDEKVIKETPRIQDGNAAHYQNEVKRMVQYSAKLTAADKLVVEYWADGPESELPPGHWGLFAQFVSKRDKHNLENDAKMFFSMHNALMDAGIVAWHLKRKFDGVRPITAVRYHYQGQSIAAWGGPGRPAEPVAGEKWTPYNPGSNLTPAFPGYISGHSTFSAAAGTVLQAFTGSDDFGYTTVIPANFGRVEPGVPAIPTVVSFKKFSDAVKEAGESRLLGGIHFRDDNTVGQELGALAGNKAWVKANRLFSGSSN